MLALALVLALLPSAPAREILVRHECHRCHEIEGLTPPPREKNCAACHADISTSGADPSKTAAGQATYGDAWDRFVTRTGQHYVRVPSLIAMHRLRASWLRRFLASPWDLRPHLSESMIRPNLTNAERDVLVIGWQAAPDGWVPDRDPARVERGRQLFEARACATCHHFGATGHVDSDAPVPDLVARAPDLRHARDRLPFDTLVQWIEQPSSVKPASPMPDLGVPHDDAVLLAEYLVHADPPRPPPASKVNDPALDGPVPTWEVVRREVFSTTCWHCHSDPLFNGGDGGPGNTGGFGYRGAGLSVATWSDLLSSRALRPGPSGEPVLLERLRARSVEAERERVGLPPSRDTPPGMPLGLPPLTPRQLDLVERWLAAGHPGPGETR